MELGSTPEKSSSSVCLDEAVRGVVKVKGGPNFPIGIEAPEIGTPEWERCKTVGIWLGYVCVTPPNDWTKESEEL
ncbi:hypothetical protein NPIL_408661 [Nephila pilipes]|uniref:Uncharacterized protein n=2 Tax=Nephila pilipes TaxID=299642 RepID=A0A8X6I5B1_NEPPI|nr:hypothetical protein NPIL_24491 [Nephila pilipes]GFS79433.1 hypothetical protein NPIL_585681 [Nephila pilipes]GFT36822.1 hypothetical protein NPIL_408661 [Nephila pilipes]